MKSFFLLISSFIICHLSCQAQGEMGMAVGRLEINTAPGGQVKVIQSTGEEREIKGSPYALEFWQSAVVTFKSGLEYETSLAQYNAQSGLLEVKLANDHIKQFNSTVVNQIVFDTDDRKFISLRLLGDKVSLLGSFGFLEQLNDGKVKVLVRYGTHIKNAYYVPALDTGTSADEILLKKEYYYLKGTQIEKLPSGKNERLSIFSDQFKSVNDFVKSNKKRVKNLDDFLEVVQYYNSL